MKIFLIGFMGAGKSTTGRRLAGILNYTFADTDRLIEERAGMTIPDIFRERGEDYFRNLEHDIISEVAGSNKDIVVSTGGGAPCFMNNMEILNRSGITVYLRLEPSQLYERLSSSRLKDRPLIKDKSPEDLLNYITYKLQEREPFYNQSRIVMEGKDIKLSILVEKIQEEKLK